MIISIIVITIIISFICFRNDRLMNKLHFSSWFVVHRKEYYRMISYGFVHADWGHLFINMFVLFSFGNLVITVSKSIFKYPDLFFILLYFGGMTVSVLYSLVKHRNNYYYAAVGASGAVSSVLFCSIVFQPQGIIQILFLPFDIPAFIFGILYLLYSAYMAKQSKDNIGHDAHFLGALFGIVLPLILKPQLLNLMIKQIFG